MTNKVKSLIYLSCFILSAVLYQTTLTPPTEQQFNDEQQVVEADMTIKPFTETKKQTVTN